MELQMQQQYPPWDADEDDIIRRVWASKTPGKANAAAALLPRRTPGAAQQRASALNVSARYTPRPPKPPPPPERPRGFPLPGDDAVTVPHAQTVKRLDVILDTPPKVQPIGSCDRGDIEAIRRRIEHVALALSGERQRPYHDVVAVIERLARERFKPDAELRMNSEPYDP